MRVMVMVKATNCGRWREAWARHPVQGTILFANCAGPKLCGSQLPSLDLVGVRGVGLFRQSQFGCASDEAYRAHNYTSTNLARGCLAQSFASIDPFSS